jgi:hypothetical protein
MSSGRSTDVPHSLAGYYYQLLLACNELVILLNEDPDKHDYCVAVEKGADIRVSKEKHTNMESKFYKSECFQRYDTPVRHTIYNFYSTYASLLKDGLPAQRYIFKTNVVLSDNDKSFFEAWRDKHITDYSSYIGYVKACIVYESIQKKSYKPAFHQYQKDQKKALKRKEDLSFAESYRLLMADLGSGGLHYEDYSDMLDDKSLTTFIDQLDFEFADERKLKWQSIELLQQEVTRGIQTYSLQHHNIQTTEVDGIHIRNGVIEAFFKTVMDDDRYTFISVGELIDRINNVQKYKVEFLHEQNLIDFIETLWRCTEVFGRAISYEGYESHKQALLDAMGVFIEKFCDETKNTDIQSLTGRYVMGPHQNNPVAIYELLRSMSIYSVFKEQDLGQLRLSGLKGIGNISFQPGQQYALKNPAIADLQINTNFLIGEFIRDTVNNIEKQIPDEDIVVFGITNPRCQVCKFDKTNLKQVFDISQVDGNAVYEELFSSMTYKCTQCLQFGPDAEQTKNAIDCFLKGNC